MGGGLVGLDIVFTLW